MEHLAELISYICSHSPEKPLELDTVARLLYLADWSSVVEGGEPLTNCVWRIGPRGPIAEEIEAAIRSLVHSQMLSITKTPEIEWLYPTFWSYLRPARINNEPERHFFDNLIAKVGTDRNKLFRTVISTYPLLNKSASGKAINLTKTAEEYRRILSQSAKVVAKTK
jgi:hypothetical protein